MTKIPQRLQNDQNAMETTKMKKKKKTKKKKTKTKQKQNTTKAKHYKNKNPKNTLQKQNPKNLQNDRSIFKTIKSTEIITLTPPPPLHSPKK